MINYIPQKLSRILGLIAMTGLSGLVNAQAIDWAPAGPVFNAGRSRNMIVDKSDPSGNKLYTGSVSSGVFTTINGGLNWSPVNDSGTVRNISYMAQGADNVIYAATGEGFLREGQAKKAQPGTGVYKLNAAGNGLVAVPGLGSSAIGTIIYRIACHPTQANKMALATNRGVFICDGLPAGAGNLTPMFTPTAGIIGMDVKYDNSGNLYFSMGNERSKDAVTGTLTPSSKVYKSIGGGSPTPITPPPGIIASSRYGRIELAIAPSDNNVIYASIANKADNPVGVSSSLDGLFVSYDAGSNWTLVRQGSGALDPLTNSSDIASGDYAHVLLVSPTNPNELFVGGYFCYAFVGLGANAVSSGTWLPIGNPYALNFPLYLHENIHDIKIVGSGSTAKFYFVTDAGIYRSVDLAGLSPNSIFPPSFQPFYGGLVTGQFNSVSIKNFPNSTNASTAIPGESIVANDAYIGGTDGNGLTYYDGKYPSVLNEISYSSGEIYEAEFSKLLPKAAYFTNGTGSLYRTSDVETAQPTALTVNSYSGALSKITPVPGAYNNGAVEQITNPVGTIFKLWENYGQVSRPPDSLVFYNDSNRVQTSIENFTLLTTQSTFNFSVGRPNKFALIDSIAIRTGTVVYDFDASSVVTPFTGTDKKDIFIKLPLSYPTSTASTSPPIASIVGPASAAGVTLNPGTGLDAFSVTFTAPPYATKTLQVSNGHDPSIYYKIFATIFYKYKKNDTITITDNSISTRPVKYVFALDTSLRWSATPLNGPKPISAPTNPLQKIPARYSARLAVVLQNGSITGPGINAVVVSKAPLNLNDPLSFIRVSQDGALTTDASGAPTSFTTSVVGKPNLLQWGKNGTELYYATDSNNLYRISNLGTLMDYSPNSYFGKLSTDIFKYASPIPNPPTFTINPNSPYRTTLIGKFTKPITSISIAKGDSSMALTFQDPTGTIVMTSGKNIKTGNSSNIVFTSKTGTLTNLNAYCAILEKDNDNEMFIGTNNGIFHTYNLNASPPTWANVNSNNTSKLPNVEVFDIEQQTVEPWNCYNSGQIYAATNGRGIWTNRSYYEAAVVSVKEIQKSKTENNLSIYPNPTNGGVYVSFSSLGGETATINVLDINGRAVKTENLGKLHPGQSTYTFDTGDLSAGLYIVNISSDSGVRRVSKLIVTK